MVATCGRLSAMQVVMATSPGTPGRPNEDFTGAVPTAAVLLDGAGIVGSESICRHGVAWYTHRLGGALLGRLSRDDDRDLTTLLSEAIEDVTDDHRRTCDVTNPSSPQATVGMLRLHEDRADYLVLADTFLLLDQTNDRPLVITDEREVTIRRRLDATMQAAAEGTPEYERARNEFIQALGARRNQPGGYWIAKDSPQAAAEAVTGSRPIADLTGVALLSYGASRIVDPYRLADWSDVLTVLHTAGPAEIIRRVRQAEADRTPDDATLVYCTQLGDRLATRDV
jgi:hypothetical protein